MWWYYYTAPLLFGEAMWNLKIISDIKKTLIGSLEEKTEYRFFIITELRILTTATNWHLTVSQSTDCLLEYCQIPWNCNG